MHYEASLGVAYIFHRVYLAKICDKAKRMQQLERLLLNEQYITLLSRQAYKGDLDESTIAEHLVISCIDSYKTFVISKYSRISLTIFS
jgi:hypothetical protein